MIFLIKKTIIKCLKDFFPHKENFNINIQIPQNIDHGNLCTNVAMVYCNNNDNYIEIIIQTLKDLNNIYDVTYVKPGFINIFLQPDILHMFKNGFVFTECNTNISIEYASPNPTGPCHIGHARGSIIGDILANVFIYLYYNVRKDCIFNDAGKQVEALISSIFYRYAELKNKDKDIQDLFYKGDYIIDLAKNYINEELNKEDFIKKKEEILNIMKYNMKISLNMLKIQHNTIIHESQLYDERIICWDILKQKNLLEYETNNNGTKISFRSSQFADDKDRVIERENGTITYFGSDIAYHFKKKNLTPDKLFTKQIIILGDDHIGYLKRLTAVVKYLHIDLKIVTHNLVKIIKNKEELKMSKRNGVFITIEDFLKKYNQSLLRLLLIEHSYSSLITIDLDQLDLENSTLFYIQYAYTRLCSILEKGQMDKENLDLNLLNTIEDKKLISLIVFWPEFITTISIALDVHLILVYIKNLCKILHHYFANIPILQKDITLRNTKLFLLNICLYLLKDIIYILKIDVTEKM
jgi:arginyl-tRNA synthetase